MRLSISPVATIQGVLKPPSDKSLTHRSYLFASIASGESRVRSPLRGEDCESTLHCLAKLGLAFEWVRSNEIRLIPSPEWNAPSSLLDCGNSGTTMRLLSGLIASRPMDATLVGDASLSRRPMGRIVRPLTLMGAHIEGERPPLVIHGALLKGIRYESPVASAQVKSCLLLAGLRAEGSTTVVEPSLSRDHTERMLSAMGAHLIRTGSAGSTQAGTAAALPPMVTVHPTSKLDPFELTVPGDISSAAFFMVAAACLPEGHLVLQDLSINPTRTGILDVLEECGVKVEIGNLREELGEPVADAELRAPKDLRPFSIFGALVPRLIDELPVLAVLATQCLGTSTIRDARELRVKESDRIALVADGLRSMGAMVETFDDGMAITGPTKLKATTVQAEGDHRIAMAFAIAGLLATGVTHIEGAESIQTSFPGFELELERLSIV